MHPTPCIVIAVFDHWNFRNNHSKPMFPKSFFRSFHGNCDRMLNQLFKLLSYQTRRFESPFLSLSLSLTHPRFNSTNVQASYCPLSLSLSLPPLHNHHNLRLCVTTITWRRKLHYKNIKKPTNPYTTTPTSTLGGRIHCSIPLIGWG